MTACARPECDGGTIGEDGFCDMCGLEALPEAVSTRTSASTSTATAAWTPSTSTMSTSSTGTTSSRRGSSRTASRGLLGAGLVQVPPVPARDPATAVLANPQVPENKRYCSKCGTKVGRGKDDKPGREDGYCPKCGNHFSFTPKLSRGEMVHGQYEVLGCLAHGGLGWIYLARDRAVGDRWVALKGLLDSGDADAFAAAKAERQFLADVEHPSIVKIYNFVEHSQPGDDGAAGGSVGYIVMEYVGGTSVKDLIKRHREEVDPAGCLPPEQAIAYALDMLPVLGFLHGIGLLFCDFKPDNMIQSEEQLKLIDLGAVRHAEDHRTAIYGTIGYQAPEIGESWPTVSSDLYTVGRSLAVMSFPFDFQIAYRHSLPGPAQVPMLADYDSYYRFLLRATAKEPAKRFADAEQMRDQLTGVLREVLATQDGQPRSGTSKEFTTERRTFGLPSGSHLQRPELTELATVLPVPLADAEDPGIVFLADVTTTDPKKLVAELSKAQVGGAEVRLRLARAHLDLGQPAEAGKALDKLATTAEPDDWRLDWYRGLVALSARQPKDAHLHFAAVYEVLPGEAAPKLALAASAEALGDLKSAERYYRVVWRTDRTYVSAAFGLARVLLATGDRAEAVDVLNSVPFTSNHHLVAQLSAIRARTAAPKPEDLTEPELVAAGAQLADLTELDAERQALVTRDLLEAALGWVRAKANGTAKGHVLGHRLSEPDLRIGLESCYRTLARQAGSKTDRVALVDLANTIRPRTWT
jgi:serine/threonine-protein kinase PknG